MVILLSPHVLHGVTEHSSLYESFFFVWVGFFWWELDKNCYVHKLFQTVFESFIIVVIVIIVIIIIIIIIIRPLEFCYQFLKLLTLHHSLLGIFVKSLHHTQFT